MSTFTEVSYAAFLFGGGICESCEKPTRAMYRSFGIRLRLCRDDAPYTESIGLRTGIVKLETARTAPMIIWNDTKMLSSTPKRTWSSAKNCTTGTHCNKRLIGATNWRMKLYFDLIALDIDQALLKLAENRKRKAQEILYTENRNAVAQHYQRLRSKQPQPILPSLPVFRRLPVVTMLQGSSPSTVGEGPSKVAHALKKEKFVTDRLNEQLKAWREQAQKDLGAVLGYPNWRTANTKVLHPVDRITARFLCTVCSKMETKYRDEESLDFAGACAHHCRGVKKRNKEDEVWKPETFVKDGKAIAALSKLLPLCTMEETSAEDKIKVEALSDTILCTSCESGIILNPKSLIGHSHRHDDMQFRVLSPEEAATYLEYPPVPSLVSTLGGPERRVKAARERVNFGCRHCLNAHKKKADGTEGEQPPQPPPQDATGEGDKPLPRGRGPKKATLKFSFNGLWSHIKEKHGIDSVRDEDVYAFEPIDLKQLTSK
ncbi:hypothetical protein DXG03_007938 [Asterophora parasitica]|uniref:Uncharacterized protein n=1 Tax=Asterophora parasitica TaxID=117018 RepID=A0A9P7KDB4_9AGAR|nr:hypothetical protein DXG03_007938 [Asterophora parasitica]